MTFTTLEKLTTGENPRIHLSQNQIDDLSQLLHETKPSHGDFNNVDEEVTEFRASEDEPKKVIGWNLMGLGSGSFGRTTVIIEDPVHYLLTTRVDIPSEQDLREKYEKSKHKFFDKYEINPEDLLKANKELFPHFIDIDEPTEAEQRMDKEATTLMEKINHPRVPGVNYKDRNKFFMNFYPKSQTLIDWVHEKKRPLIEIYYALLSAAAVFHDVYTNSKGQILHRDVKPTNMLYVPGLGVVVIDWGLVKDKESSQLTAAGAIMGSPGFMSAQQVIGEPYDESQELYAFGVTEYHLLTGSLPFMDSNVMRLMEKIKNHKGLVSPYDRTGGKVPLYLSDVIMKCLAKHPGDRYRNIGEHYIVLATLKDEHPTFLQDMGAASPSGNDIDRYVIMTRPQLMLPQTQIETIIDVNMVETEDHNDIHRLRVHLEQGEYEEAIPFFQAVIKDDEKRAVFSKYEPLFAALIKSQNEDNLKYYIPGVISEQDFDDWESEVEKYRAALDQYDGSREVSNHLDLDVQFMDILRKIKSLPDGVVSNIEGLLQENQAADVINKLGEDGITDLDTNYEKAFKNRSDKMQKLRYDILNAKGKKKEGFLTQLYGDDLGYVVLQEVIVRVVDQYVADNGELNPSIPLMFERASGFVTAGDKDKAKAEYDEIMRLTTRPEDTAKARNEKESLDQYLV